MTDAAEGPETDKIPRRVRPPPPLSPPLPLPSPLPVSPPDPQQPGSPQADDLPKPPPAFSQVLAPTPPQSTTSNSLPMKPSYLVVRRSAPRDLVVWASLAVVALAVLMFVMVLPLVALRSSHR